MPNEEYQQGKRKVQFCEGKTSKVSTQIKLVWNGCESTQYIFNVFKYFIFPKKIFFNFAIYFLCLIMLFLMNAPLIFHHFIFYGRIALRLVSYAAKLFAEKMLVARYLWPRFLQ